jgi:hypothetical protein
VKIERNKNGYFLRQLIKKAFIFDNRRSVKEIKNLKDVSRKKDAQIEQVRFRNLFRVLPG